MSTAVVTEELLWHCTMQDAKTHTLRRMPVQAVFFCGGMLFFDFSRELSLAIDRAAETKSTAFLVRTSCCVGGSSCARLGRFHAVFLLSVL